MSFDRARRRMLAGGGSLALGVMVGGCGGGGETGTGPVAGTETFQGLPAPSSTSNTRYWKIVGYSDRESYAPGETARIFLSAEDSRKLVPVSWEVRQYATDMLVATGTTSVVARRSPGPGDQGWPQSAQFAIGPQWPSGVYYVACRPSTGRRLFFVVRDTPQAPNPLLLIVSTATMQAYNAYGGKSLYDFSSTRGIRASSVSCLRPIAPDQVAGGSDFDWGYEGLGVADLVRWLEATGRAPAVATDQDLHGLETLLAGRRCVILSGHDEYWSASMRDRIDAHVARGGHVMNLGGNTAYWQIRYEDSGTTIVCTKDAATDPVADPAAKTTWWHTLGRSAGTTFGSAPEFGAYNDKQAPSLTLTAWRTHHWAHWGTGLSDGMAFGGNLAFADYEVDGIDTVWVDGVPGPRPGSGAPANYQVLAHAPATGWYSLAADSGGSAQGNMAIGIWSHASGGTVFNGATIKWGLAMRGVGASRSANPAVRMTDNVLAHLLAPDIVVWQAGDGRLAYLPQAAPAPSDGASWSIAGSLCHAPAQAIDAQMVPLRRFQSTSGAAREILAIADPGPAWNAAGIAGWVYEHPADGRLPLHRFVRTLVDGSTDERYDLGAVARPDEEAAGVIAWVLA